MNTTQLTAIETAALDLMLKEAIRTKNTETFATLTNSDESEAAQSKVQSLLDGFFR